MSYYYLLKKYDVNSSLIWFTSWVGLLGIFRKGLIAHMSSISFLHEPDTTSPSFML